MVINATKQEPTPLLLKLIDIQGNLSDLEFTGKLGIERSTWTHIRKGRRAVGITLLKAIIRTYPELTSDVINFLKGNHE